MKQPCQAIREFLTGNLGKRCMGGLTGTDWRALTAAVHIIELYTVHRDPAVLQAFGLIVGQMQRSMQELAYHAIAAGLNWEDREPLWAEAGLEPFARVSVCVYGPGGIPPVSGEKWNRP